MHTDPFLKVGTVSPNMLQMLSLTDGQIFYMALFAQIGSHSAHL